MNASSTIMLSQAEQDTRLSRASAREWAGPCPRCAGRDRFRVKGDKWMCRHCSNRWRDLAGYYHEMRDMPWPEAFRAAGIEPGERSQARQEVEEEPVRDVASPEWQAVAMAAFSVAREAIWTTAGLGALRLLHDRGVRDETIRARGLGFASGAPVLLRQGPAPWPSMMVPGPGVLIPWFVGGALWQVKVRLLRPTDPKNKILHCRWMDHARDVTCPPPAAAPTLYGADTLRGHDVAILVEGELDAILLHQEVGDLVGVVTLGSAFYNLPARAIPHLLPLRRILVAYDTDTAGHEGAERMICRWPGLPLERIEVPIRLPAGKDITDFHLSRGSLRDWIRFHLER